MKRIKKAVGYLFVSFMAAPLIACGQSQSESVPEIVCEKPKLEDVYQYDQVTLPTVTAKDAKDGDITSKLVVTVTDQVGSAVEVVENKFVASLVGTYDIKYSVTNSSNKSANLALNLKALDAAKPIISSDEPGERTVYTYLSNEIAMPVVTIKDHYDGDSILPSYAAYDADDITAQLPIDDGKIEVLPDKQYIVKVSATNSKGAKSTMTFVYNTLLYSMPVIESEVKEIEMQQVDSLFSLPSVTVSDAGDPDLGPEDVVKTLLSPEGEVEIKDDKATLSTKGEYTLTYSVTNAFGQTGTLEFKFDVVDFNTTIVALDGFMYDDGTSAITSEMYEEYKEVVNARFRTAETSISYVKVNTPNELKAIKDTADVFVGFTQNQLKNAEIYETATNKRMEMAGTTRYVSKLGKTPLSDEVFKFTQEEQCLEAFKLKHVVLAYCGSVTSDKFDEDALNAGDALLETYITDTMGLSGVSVSHISYGLKDAEWMTGEGKTDYEKVHDDVIAKSATYAIGWATTISSKSAFGFTSINANNGNVGDYRYNIALKSGKLSDRKMFTFVKLSSAVDTNGYYSDIFSYVQGASFESTIKATNISAPTIEAKASELPEEMRVYDTITLPGIDITGGDFVSDPEKNALEVKLTHNEEEVSVSNNKFMPEEAGSYTAEYTLTDAKGLKGSASLTFEVKEAVGPSIEVDTSEGKGYLNTPYAIPDAIVTDRYDGTLTPSVKVTHGNEEVAVADGKFTPTEVGEHVITWTAVDSHGLSASATKKVNVLDSKPAPTIAIDPETPPQGYTGIEYIMPVATATDVEEGVIECSLSLTHNGNAVAVTEGKFTPEEAGTYLATWSATNAAGVTGTLSKNITVIDPSSPLIEYEGTIANQAIGNSVTLGAYTATDEIDGDITDKVVKTLKDPDGLDVAITDGSFTVEKEGTYTLTLSVTDSIGMTGEREITFLGVDPENLTDVNVFYCYAGSKDYYTTATASIVNGASDAYLLENGYTFVDGDHLTKNLYNMVAFHGSEYKVGSNPNNYPEFAATVKANKGYILIGYGANTINGASYMGFKNAILSESMKISGTTSRYMGFWGVADEESELYCPYYEVGLGLFEAIMAGLKA